MNSKKKMTKDEIADQLFDLANALALSGENTGHLAGIIHSVVSELWHPEVSAVGMIGGMQAQLAMVKGLKGKGNAKRTTKSTVNHGPGDGEGGG